MKKSDKVEFVDWMKGELEKSPSAVLADYRGLTVAQMTDLRRRCREAGVQFKVVKNTLMRLVIQGTGMESLGEFLAGPSALAWHYEDPGAAAKVLVDFAKEKDNEALEIKGAAASGRALSAVETREVLARMPSRPELLSQMAALIAAGPQKLVNVLAAGPNKLGRALGALKAEREAA